MNHFCFSCVLLCMFLSFQSCTSSWQDSEETFFERDFDNDFDVITKPNPICLQAAEAFGLAVSNYTLCSIKNARPINLCQGCVREYLSVLKSHDSFWATVDDKKISCKTYFTDLDRLEIVGLNLAFVNTLWSKGYCDNCFTRNENGTIGETIRDEVKEFNWYYRLTERCVRSQADINTTCTTCRMIYDDLNVFYTKLEEKYGEELCFDVVDTMNRTRDSWSNSYNCFPVRKSEFWLYFLMVLMGVIPVGFYALAFLLSNVQEATVVRIRRMGDRIDLLNAADSASHPINLEPGTSST